MQVTSESLFHFTNSLKNLETILLKKFQLTYCNEKFRLGSQDYNEYFPMISFCDLPLGLIKDHIEKYGSYGIGMTKEWGIKHKLNPVLYIEKNSIISKDIDVSLESLDRLLDIYTEIKPHLSDELKKKLGQDLVLNVQKTLNIVRFIKNYNGPLIRGKKTYSNYRFYDEREWRFIPSYDANNIKPRLDEADYKKYRGNSKTKPLIDSIKLEFMSSDIKYLIVKESKDIPKLIRLIKSIDNLSKNPNEADILTTKILTVDQIKKDL